MHRTTHTGTTARCRTTRRNAFVTKHRGGMYSRMKWPQPQPPHTRNAFHGRLQPFYTEKDKISWSDFLPNLAIMQPFHCDLRHKFKTRIELRTQEQPLVTKHKGGTHSRMTATATAAHRRYLSSPASAILHGKLQGFILLLPPQYKPHIICIYPL